MVIRKIQTFKGLPFKIKEEMSIQLFLLDERTEQIIHYPHHPPTWACPRKEDTLNTHNVTTDQGEKSILVD